MAEKPEEELYSAIFVHSNPKQLQEALNKFLLETHPSDLIDVKYSSSISVDPNLATVHELHSALVIYKETI